MSKSDFPEVFSSRPLVYRPTQVVRLTNPIPMFIFLLFGGLGYGLFSTLGGVAGSVLLGASLVLGVVLSSAVKIAAEWEKGIVFRLGKYHSQRGPGIFTVLPFFDNVKMIDTRIRTLEIPHRQAITKDNVPVRIDGVIFMRVEEPASAVIRVQNFEEAVQEYAQTALRDIVGSTSLDDILADRESLGRKVEEMVETEIDGWGIEVAGIRIQDIELPEDLKRVMARQASAEREKRATITKAEGDREAAENLAAAAKTMSEASGALQLRTLQTLDGLGTSPSNTVVLAVPTEVFEALRAVPGITKAIAPKDA
jgi:regulator of protease activity HflC (stomatin/prohibitin superfamily)